MLFLPGDHAFRHFGISGCLAVGDVEHGGAYGNFTKGDPVAFLENITLHMPTAGRNEPVFVERAGYTYQMKEQEVADVLLEAANRWRKAE